MITKQRKILVIEFAVIILLWTLAVISPLFFMNDFNQDWRAVYVLWIEYGVIGIIYLINRFVLMPKLFFVRKYLEYCLYLVVLLVALGVFVLYYDGVNIILSMLGRDFSDDAFPFLMTAPPPVMGRGVPLQPHAMTTIPPEITVIIFTLIVIALDMGLSIAVKWIISEQRNTEMSKERVVAQLSNLQNQVSPHFFMNTLNNIHALVEIDQHRAQKTIIELSSLMDYLLYESSQHETILLAKELEFIQNYINLMRLRYPDRVVVDFSYDKELPEVKIAPLLFLNFIENTFKYGVDYAKDSFIMINFSREGNFIVMTSQNSNHAKGIKNKEHKGIGIANTQKRLKLLYGNNFTLKIDDTPNLYIVKLKVPIS